MAKSPFRSLSQSQVSVSLVTISTTLLLVMLMHCIENGEVRSGLRSRSRKESERFLVGVGVGFLRTLEVGVGFFVRL